MNRLLTDEDLASLQALLEAARKLQSEGWTIQNVSQGGMSAERAGHRLAIRKFALVEGTEGWEAELTVRTYSEAQAVINGATQAARVVIDYAGHFGVKL